VAPLVVWLGSAASAHVTGRIFEVAGGEITVVNGHTRGPTVDNGSRWDPAEVGKAVDDLLTRADAPLPVYGT
jgi:hypothetical protein